MTLARGLAATCFALSPLFMGNGACNPPDDEVCDGVDNDGDGQIDEDFDQDGDGYFAATCENGADCNDQDASVHPGATEAQDGVDNDCDGSVDEGQSVYRIRFQDVSTGVPVPGIPVWLGLDGKGQAYTSDAEGEVSLELESPVVTWSYGNTYVRQVDATTRETRQIYSTLNDRLEPVTTIKVSNGSVPAGTVYSGTVKNIDTTAEAGVVWVSGDEGSSDQLEPPYQAEMPYSFSSYRPPGAILAAQYASREYSGSLVGWPIRFGYAPVQQPLTDVTLDRTFDQTLNLQVEGNAPGLLDVERVIFIYNASETIGLGYSGPSAGVGDPGWSEIAYPSLTGPLASVLIEAVLAVSDGVWRQEVWCPIDGESSSVPIVLPPLFELEPYAPLYNATLAGSVLDASGVEGSEYLYARYSDQERLTSDTNIVLNHTWTVTQREVTAPVVFPLIHAGAFTWPDSRAGQARTVSPYLQYGRMYAIYGATDDRPYRTSARLTLETVAP